MQKNFLFLCCVLFFTNTSSAQILKKLGDKVNRKIENAVNTSIDKTIDKTIDKISHPESDNNSSKTKEKTKDKTQPSDNTSRKSDAKPTTQTTRGINNDHASNKTQATDDCQKEAEKKKGSWEKSAEFNYEYPTTDEKRFKPNMNRVMESIAALVTKYNPTPTGSQAKWEQWFTRSADTVSRPDRSIYTYEFVGKFRPYVCNKGKIEVSGITDTWMFVRINRFHPSEITEQHQINAAFGDKMFSLGKQLGTLGGYPYFEPAPSGIRQIPEVLYSTVLISRPGQLPYTAVTRGEFLNICKKWLGMVESGKLKATGNAGTMRANLDKLFQLNKEDMNEPAIIRNPEWNFNDLSRIDADRQNIFTTPEEGYQLLRANPAYVNTSLSKWKPQFMVVTWYRVAGKQNSVELDKAMREHFDFKKLEALIN